MEGKCDNTHTQGKQQNAMIELSRHITFQHVVRSFLSYHAVKTNLLCRGKEQENYQCKFQNGSTIHQIFTFRQLMEKWWEYNKILHQLWINFKEGHDHIRRVEMWNVMADVGIPKTLIGLIKACVTK